jgi:hypothetical protein
MDLTKLILLLCSLALLLGVTFVLTDPRFWAWALTVGRGKPTRVEFKFTVNGKLRHWGRCRPDETEPIGVVHLIPERQLGEYVILPVRYVKTPDVGQIPPIRVKRSDTCMLEVRRAYGS